MSKTLENSPVITTLLTSYCYNTNNETEKKAYDELRAELSETRQCINAISTNSSRKKIVCGVIQLETRHVFNDQWNTTVESETNPAIRVYDWYENIEHNANIKQGHYLTINSEMNILRNSVAKCDNCGAMHWLNDTLLFCDQCLDSEYLEESQLHRLRLRPISDSDDEMPPLTHVERGTLIHAYVVAQTVGINSRAVAAKEAQRESLEKEYKKAMIETETKYNGFIWLMDKHINIQNCIYYSHLNVFCFGFKQAVSPSVRDAILEVINDFPFPYQIKCDDGKTLENK